MLVLPDSFLNGDMAIIVPEEHFDNFCDACVDAGLEDAEENSYTRKWAQDQFEDSYTIFCHNDTGILVAWRLTERGRAEFEDETGCDQIVEWSDAFTDSPPQEPLDTFELL